VLVFLFVHLLPGDPARLAAGQEADEATVELVRQDLGLDKPLHEQFVTFFTQRLAGRIRQIAAQRGRSATEIGRTFHADAAG
jgi:glutathione transport system permease protein